jgi:hypothetical protein
MPYKEKIKELIVSSDPQARMLGYSILMGKLNVGNIVYWFYTLSKIPKTEEKKAVDEYIRQVLKISSEHTTTPLTFVSDYIKINLTNIDADSLNYHFYMVNMNLFNHIMKNHSMSTDDTLELKSKIKALEVYAGEFNKNM